MFSQLCVLGVCVGFCVCEFNCLSNCRMKLMLSVLTGCGIGPVDLRLFHQGLCLVNTYIHTMVAKSRSWFDLNRDLTAISNAI